ncbi:uncharacterized protein [Periplaneta americana]|uniref:uncharacterized protein isoform X2 n=1 Tax=Periplaneta americana TaxID=6978 RepID=UPI0037E8C0EB
MSNLQWLGIWGMTGFSKPEKSDLDKWSKGITYVLSDPKGRHYFKEFLTNEDRGFKDEAKVLEIWTNCEMFISQDHIDLGTLFDDARQNIIGDGKHALPDENNGTEVMINDIQEAAKLNLKCVFEEFIEEKRRHIK